MTYLLLLVLRFYFVYNFTLLLCWSPGSRAEQEAPSVHQSQGEDSTYDKEVGECKVSD